MSTTLANLDPVPTKENHCIVWNRKTREFHCTTVELGHAMLGVGSVEGFDSMNQSASRLDHITIRQDGSKCRVEIEGGSLLLKSPLMGRVAAKKYAATLADFYSAPLFNIKANGEIIACKS